MVSLPCSVQIWKTIGQQRKTRFRARFAIKLSWEWGGVRVGVGWRGGGVTYNKTVLVYRPRWLLFYHSSCNHSGEAMYISLIDFSWYCPKRNGFKWFNHSSFDYDYMHQLWTYIFTISLPKVIDIAPLQTCVIRVTDLTRHCNTDFSCLEWSNTNTFW